MTALDPARLSHVVSQVQEAQNAAGFAWQLSQRYHHATTDEARTELVTKASAEAKKATHAAREALESLQNAGATLPDHKPAQTNPLAELARVESSRSEALALLDALRAALPLAEALDQKRGDVLDVAIGGSAGLVWGDRLVQAVSELELELYGPGEAVTGARE